MTAASLGSVGLFVAVVMVLSGLMMNRSNKLKIYGFSICAVILLTTAILSIYFIITGDQPMGAYIWSLLLLVWTAWMFRNAMEARNRLRGENRSQLDRS
jgi:Ca2+/Na+ antiporter